MNVKMVGIDYANAAIDKREVFAFTPAQAEAAMREIILKYGAKGCVIISTCNRTELWLSEESKCDTDLVDALCALKNVSRSEYESFFVVRKNDEAFLHLCQTACGMKSQILGEDQILTQVKKALELARSVNTADTVLEKLFQTAITSAKKIKTQVRLTSYNASAATMALAKIQEVYPTLKGIKTLIVGNGEMGRMVAEKLVALGASVKVTLRKYKNGVYIMPEGCAAIDYSRRYEEVREAGLVISVTSSPHYTLRYDDVVQATVGKPNKLFVDLAVPRDIDPTVADLANINLIDMDSLGILPEDELNQKALAQAEQIIKKYMTEFRKWYKFRAFVPVINDITSVTAEKIYGNIKKELAELDLTEIERNLFEEKLSCVAEKAISGLLFGIKDSVQEEQWGECFTNLGKVVK
ncbi:MAG: glutamyl-tRNA reductase [Clostridia bacterium]|nr:glutamyl-tRNA reductase [Clostridia bacterium]